MVCPPTTRHSPPTAGAHSRLFVRRFFASHFLLLPLMLPALLSGCLAGASSALGGGPIGRAPDLKAGALLAEPDSTRGQGFVLISNRTDLLDETRVELNAAARAYERLLGSRPNAAEIRLTSTDRDVTVYLKVGGRTIAPITLPLQRGGRAGGRVSEARRIASGVVLVMSREWLTGFLREFAPNDSGIASREWMNEGRIGPWLRLGLLQGVAENPLQDLWLAQLGRQRESLMPVSQLVRPDACDAACLAPFTRVPRATDGAPNAAAALAEDDAASVQEAQRRGSPGRGRLPALEGRVRFVASSYALTHFFAKREGAPFIRNLVATSLAGGDLSVALGTARSFSASWDDIDRQWRVWLATYAYGSGGPRMF